jgi:hypothetical protein
MNFESFSSCRKNGVTAARTIGISPGLCGQVGKLVDCSPQCRHVNMRVSPAHRGAFVADYFAGDGITHSAGFKQRGRRMPETMKPKPSSSAFCIPAFPFAVMIAFFDQTGLS